MDVVNIGNFYIIDYTDFISNHIIGNRQTDRQTLKEQHYTSRWRGRGTTIVQEVVIADLSLSRLIQSGHRTMTPLWSHSFSYNYYILDPLQLC